MANFSWLFWGILSLLVLQPLAQTSLPAVAASLEAVFSSLLLFGIWSLRPFRLWFFVALGLLVVELVALVLHFVGGGLAWSLVSSVSLLAFCVLSAVITMRFILSQTEIDRNQVLGASSVYLLLGIIFAFLFEIVRAFDATAFAHVAAEPGLPGAGAELLYFSFVTLTTLGYGDVAPLTPITKTLAALEAVVGQLFLAVLIAGLVGRIALPLGREDR